MSKPVLILGAGAASAAAALALSKAGRHSIVLEAQSRIGGRISTRLEFGAPIDLGASYIHGFEHEHNPAKRMAAELEIPHHIAKPEAGQVFTMDGKPVDGDAMGKASGTLTAAVSKITDSVRSQVGGPDSSYGHALYKELADAPLAIGIARVGELGGIPLESISTLHYKTESPLAGVDAMPVGGYQPMLEKAFKKAGADVKFNQEVVSIKRGQGQIEVKTKSGETYTASHAICTIPLTVLKTGSVTFDPPLPQDRLKLMERTSVGILNKILLVYPNVWWPAKASHFLLLPPSTSYPKTGNAIRDILTSGPLLVSNVHAVSIDQPAALLGYLGADRAEAIEKYSPEEVGKELHELLSNILAASNDVTITPPVKVGMTKWRSDPFSLGATTGPVPLAGGADQKDYDLLGEPLWDKTLLFAGEHTLKDWRGSVAGALKSGLREAERITGEQTI